jgi:hypothetical protein
MTRGLARILPATAASLLAIASTLGCGAEGGRAAARDEPATPPDGTYTVRAVVVAVPEPEREDDRQLRVRHEAIPDFVGFDGEVVGMASMTMPFPAAAGVDLEGVAVGDLVEMTFEVRWEGSPPLRIIELRDLPPGSELDFETAEPLPGEADVAVEGAGSQPP